MRAAVIRAADSRRLIAATRATAVAEEKSFTLQSRLQSRLRGSYTQLKLVRTELETQEHETKLARREVRSLEEQCLKLRTEVDQAHAELEKFKTDAEAAAAVASERDQSALQALAELQGRVEEVGLSDSERIAHAQRPLHRLASLISTAHAETLTKPSATRSQAVQLSHRVSTLKALLVDMRRCVEEMSAATGSNAATNADPTTSRRSADICTKGGVGMERPPLATCSESVPLAAAPLEAAHVLEDLDRELARDLSLIHI